MQTTIKTITPESLKEAKAIIDAGGVVAMPTETVYGLGGSAFNDEAVKRIFEIKGRPNDNPLIAHVHADYDLKRIVDFDPPYAKKLREAFLPGPLTIVYPSKGRVSPFVSCGLETLAIRVPAHAGAQAFLKEVDIPVVAPSANLSRHVSPTSAGHVFDDFNGKIPLILDGGECSCGIESTVVDATGEIPVILRPGMVTREMIADVVGACEVYGDCVKEGERAKSPGLLYKHYAPKCKTALYSSSQKAEAIAFAKEEKEKGRSVGILAQEKERAGVEDFVFFSLGNTSEDAAARLYKSLREAEKQVDVLVAIEPSANGGAFDGVLNRLKKACNSTDIRH